MNSPNSRDSERAEILQRAAEHHLQHMRSQGCKCEPTELLDMSEHDHDSVHVHFTTICGGGCSTTSLHGPRCQLTRSYYASQN